MKLLARILALFLIMPAVELALLVQVDKLIGFWPTVGIIVLTGGLGGYLAKREGLSVWHRLNERMSVGDLPSKEILDGVIILCAGALLITPGVLSDLLGFLGFIPPTRALIRKLVERWVDKSMKRNATGIFGFGSWEADMDFPGDPGAYERWDAEMDIQEIHLGGQAKDLPHHAHIADPPDDAGSEK